MSTKVVNLTTNPKLEGLAALLDEQGRGAESRLRNRWNSARREQGIILLEYQKLYRPLRQWTAFLAAIGIAEKTAYRLIDAAVSVAELPPAVIKAAEQVKRFDLAAEKNRWKVAELKSQLDGETEPVTEERAKELVNNVLQMPSPTEAAKMASKENREMLTRQERKHLEVRTKIRAALADVQPRNRKAVIIAALEEEMFDVWGELEMDTWNLTPHESMFGLDGRRKKVAA
jgi:hypothetical protein